jgi:phenylacetate-CoA ligase
MWPLQRNRAQAAFERFLNTSLDTVLERHLSISAISQALSLFRDVVDDVPAYSTFLKEQGIDPAAIQTAEDFAQLPLLTKQNYLLPTFRIPTP